VVSDAKVSGTFPIVGNTFTVSGLQRPEATDASPLPDAQLTPDTQTAKTDLVPDTQPNPDALADIAPTIKTPVIWIEGATDGNGPFDGILVANTHDNTVMRTTFTPVDPTKTYLFTRTTVQVGDPKSYSIVQSVRQYDGSGTLFCSGAIDANGQLRCSNDYGSFAVKGPTTISTKVNLEQIDPVLGTKSGTTLTLAFFVDKTVASNQNGALEAMDSDGNKFHASDFFTDSNWSEARLFGPTMVIYMTEPTVATIANKANLVNGTQSFYEFSETAASNGDVGQKQYTVAVNAIGIGSIFGAQLFVNGSLYDKASIAAFVGKDSVDIKSAVMENPPSVFRIVVTADDKFTVSAKTTKTFDLRVAVSGVHAGSVLKSWLMDDQINPDIGTIASHPDNAFLWSDCSDGCTELSADWIGGRLVKTIPTTPTFLAL
jgi:hypothetical protein